MVPGFRVAVQLCPLCQGSGAVVWVEKKVGAAMAVDTDSLTMMVNGPLEYVRLARRRLVREVESRVRRLGGDPRESRHARFGSSRQVAIDWRNEDNETRSTPALAMFKYQAKYMIPDPVPRER